MLPVNISRNFADMGAIYGYKGTFAPGGNIFQGKICFFFLRSDDDWDLGFNNTTFFRSDVCQGIAQKLRMIQTDRDDHRDERCDNIGRIQPAAQTNL